MCVASRRQLKGISKPCLHTSIPTFSVLETGAQPETGVRRSYRLHIDGTRPTVDGRLRFDLQSPSFVVTTPDPRAEEVYGLAVPLSEMLPLIASLIARQKSAQATR